MDEIHAVFFGDGHDALDIEIGADWSFSFADAVGLIRFKSVHRKSIFFGVDGNGAKSEFGGGPHHSDGDFGAIGNEEFLLAGGGGRRSGSMGRHVKSGKFLSEMIDKGEGISGESGD